MVVRLDVGPPTDPNEYQGVPIAFEVRSRLRIEADAGGPLLVEEAVSPAFIKDYDAIPGGSPIDWPSKWGIGGWGMARARGEDGRLVGGAAVVVDTPELGATAGRAVLWDLRVAPDVRGQGVGRALFEAAAGWARERGCREMLIETQDINVPACRFYAAMGCTLIGARPDAYPECPGEAELIWRLALG